MTLEQRIALINAGYNIEQIAAFEQQEQQPTQEPAQPVQEPVQPVTDPVQPLQPVQEPDPQEPVQPAQQVPDPEPEITLAQVMQQLVENNKQNQRLIATIQANAINNAGMPATPRQPNIDETFAAIMAPPPVERGK